MKSKLVILFSLFAVILCASPEKKQDVGACDKDEVQVECLRGCLETCDTYGKPCAVRVMCRPGCQCREGYVIHPKKNKCVPLDKCKCSGKNEVWSDCAPMVTDCEMSCQNDLSAVSCQAGCANRCVCKKGFIRNGTECIKPKDCLKSNSTTKADI